MNTTQANGRISGNPCHYGTKSILTVRDITIAALVSSLWGLSFLVAAWGLHDVPPLGFGGLRFGLVAGLALLLPRPNVPIRYILTYGLLWGVVQFGGLFIAIHSGLSPGKAALLSQSQVALTILFSKIAGQTPLNLRHLFVIGMAGSGLWIITADNGIHVPPIALIAIFIGSAGWAMGNVLARTIAQKGWRSDSVSFIAWSSLLPAGTLCILSAVFENGPSTISLQHWWQPTCALLFQAFGSVVLGNMAWNRLLQRHSAATIAPYALITPIIAMIAGMVFCGDRISTTSIIGSVALFISVFIHTRERNSSPTIRSRLPNM